MIDKAIGLVPVKARGEAFIWLFVILAFAAGFAANYERRAIVVTRHSVTRLSVEQQYGRPTQTVDGAQINQGLAGLTCAVYASRKTVICRP